MREPIDRECSDNARVGDHSYAMWFLQVGGYAQHAVVTLDGANGTYVDTCFTVTLWCDDEGFPGEERTIHFCSPAQFFTFADKVMRMQMAEQAATEHKP